MFKIMSFIFHFIESNISYSFGVKVTKKVCMSHYYANRVFNLQHKHLENFILIKHMIV